MFAEVGKKDRVAIFKFIVRGNMTYYIIGKICQQILNNGDFLLNFLTIECAYPNLSFHNTAPKMTFSFKGFFIKCNQIRRKLRIWSYLLKKSLKENSIFCALQVPNLSQITHQNHIYFYRIIQDESRSLPDTFFLWNWKINFSFNKLSFKPYSQILAARKKIC